MRLQNFTVACLLIAALALGFQVFDSSAQQNKLALSLFTTTMVLMTVGFDLVRRELEKLRPR